MEEADIEGGSCAETRKIVLINLRWQRRKACQCQYISRWKQDMKVNSPALIKTEHVLG